MFIKLRILLDLFRMVKVREGQIWITLQSHKNIMAVSSLKELDGIKPVNEIQPYQSTLMKSDEEICYC